uniref:C-type lectin domain-containing protein n=1 Tax=Kryptolebias marmoratus TaxID=37003 RepID=A0A3Q3F1F3_KRYMA
MFFPHGRFHFHFTLRSQRPGSWRVLFSVLAVPRTDNIFLLVSFYIPPSVVCHGLAAGQVTSRYFFFQRPMIWLEAQRFCQSHYVDLAVLSTEEEYFNLLDAIPATNSFWLGLQRQGFSRAWKWVSGEELSYKHWFKMNNEGLCASLEAMLATEEKLLGRLCDELHMIVCQGKNSYLF